MSKVWEDIASLARLTPTPHNTQPFRIRPRGDQQAQLVLLTERLLPREDHGNLYVPASFGTFAVTLERAARHFGHALSVVPIEQLDTERLETRGPEVVLGEARITGSLTARACGRLARHPPHVALTVPRSCRRAHGSRCAFAHLLRLRTPLHSARRAGRRRFDLEAERRSHHRQFAAGR